MDWRVVGVMNGEIVFGRIAKGYVWLKIDSERKMKLKYCSEYSDDELFELAMDEFKRYLEVMNIDVEKGGGG